MSNINTFSLHSFDYARFRPRYPKELFSYLCCLVQDREQAWDCATGNGQFARGCAEYFQHVEATDISEEQIEHAFLHPRITYRVCPAEKTPYPSNAFNFIGVAQAIHWFDLDRFYGEVQRLLAPGGVLAVVGYSFMKITPTIDQRIENTLLRNINPYWAEGNRLIMDSYRTIPFPFPELSPVPSFHIEVKWNFNQLLNYLRTWSAVKRYANERNQDPIQPLIPSLREVWGDPELRRTVTMPLVIKVDRKNHRNN